MRSGDMSDRARVWASLGSIRVAEVPAAVAYLPAVLQQSWVSFRATIRAESRSLRHTINAEEMRLAAEVGGEGMPRSGGNKIGCHHNPDAQI